MKYDIELEFRGFENGRIVTLDKMKVENMKEAATMSESGDKLSDTDYKFIACVCYRLCGNFAYECLLEDVRKTKTNIYEGLNVKFERDALDAVEKDQMRIFEEERKQERLRKEIQKARCRADESNAKNKLNFSLMYIDVLKKNLIRDIATLKMD